MDRIRFEDSFLDVRLDRIATKPEKYFVSLSKKGQTLASFEMKSEYDRWKIIQPAPGWVDRLANDLNRVIQQDRNKADSDEP